MFPDSITPEMLALPTLIFVLRVFNNALITVRFLLIARRQRIWASALGFIEALVFAYVTANVITNLENLLNLFAYCLGLAVGSYVGMLIEERFITSYVSARIITPIKGQELAVALRGGGFGVTEVDGRGHSGVVTIIDSLITRRQIPDLMGIVRRVQPDAFVAIEESRAVQHVILPQQNTRV